LSNLGTGLPVVPADAYFGGARAWADLPIDIVSLPDNLDDLIAAYLRLDGARRRRFLRSAAAIYSAQELWDVSISSYFLACVQAIETLIDKPPPQPCPTCKKNTGPGPTRLFQQFVAEHCRAVGVDQEVVNELYRVRSAIAHGSYLFQFDEAPWASSMAASVANHHETETFRPAITVAKEGLRNWLLSQTPGA
jgi:hypothetical protein